MQISSSVQSPDPRSADSQPAYNETAVENSETSPVWGNRQSKKTKAGLFARLLDGLTGKSRKPITNKPEIAKEGDQNIDADAANGLFNFPAEGIAQKKSRLTRGSVEVNAHENTSVLERELFSIEKNRIKDSDSFAEAGAETQADVDIAGEFISETTEEFSLSGEPKKVFKGQPLSAATEHFFAENTELQTTSLSQANAPAPLAGESAAAAEGEGFLTRQTLERGRSGRAAVDVFPARNQDSRVHQFSGEPRPALVDYIAALDQGRESVENVDARGKKGKTRSVLEIRDLRTNENRQNSVFSVTNSSNSGVFRIENSEIEIPVDLSTGFGGENTGKAKDAPLQSPGFEDALAQKLGESLNSDIIHQASVILRNGGEGVIRLSLKPENLGNVKIRLEMTENKITGHIIVESGEALAAFERELPVLEKAFRDSGFSETSLDMFLAQDNGNNQGQRQGEDYPREQFSGLVREIAVSHYESEADRRVMARETVLPDLTGKTSINMHI